jgi:uncharacterized membrane protein YgcG
MTLIKSIVAYIRRLFGMPASAPEQKNVAKKSYPEKTFPSQRTVKPSFNPNRAQNSRERSESKRRVDDSDSSTTIPGYTSGYDPWAGSSNDSNDDYRRKSYSSNDDSPVSFGGGDFGGGGAGDSYDSGSDSSSSDSSDSGGDD